MIDGLRGVVLRSVARSFYLSIRFLPAPLRDPIALAYLLARATDTLADTVEVDATQREASLQELARAIQGENSPGAISTLRGSFAPLQKNAAERALIEALPDCVAWLDQLADQDRNDIRVVLAKINRGQLLDVRRFGDAGELRALARTEDLDEYTYLVAGCVGEFWTELCFRHLRNFCSRPVEEMRQLGREYGKGLQLINILRDAGTDFRNGRCYFPEEELRACGVLPNELIARRKEIVPVLEKWLRRAGKGIAAGVDYACAIRSTRVRFATALPALIGAGTLALLRDAGTEVLQRSIKIPRREVHIIMRKLTLSLSSPRAIRKIFERQKY